MDGEWKKGKYGFQLDVSYFHMDIPQTAAGIEAYLSSEMIKGIGPVIAHRIVEKFGKRSLYVLDYTPERLQAVNPGVKAASPFLGYGYFRLVCMTVPLLFIDVRTDVHTNGLK